MSKGNIDNRHATGKTSGVRILLGTLLVLIISTTFSQSPLLADIFSVDDPSAQRLVFRSGPRGIELSSVERVPSRRLSAGPANSGSLELTVIDKASGRALCRRFLADPFLVHADTVVGENLAGGPTRLDDQLFSVVVPSVGPGQRIEISKVGDHGRLISVMDGREIGRRESQTRHSRSAATGSAAEAVYYTGDPANRLDILVLGDGYTESEMGLFTGHVDALVDGLLGSEPFDRFASFVNIHKLEVVSSQSGTDQPDQVPPVYVDTAFNSSFNFAGVPHLLYAQTSLVLEAAAAFPEYDTIILVINTSRYGGGAGAYAAFAGGSGSAGRLMLHEFGHSFGGLTDEYQSPYDTYSGPEPSAPNCTALGWFQMASEQLKWHHWLGIEGVGVNEGCEYYAHGKSRPALNCLMRSLDSDFDPVCREIMALEVFAHAAQVESREPLAQEVTLGSAAQTFLVRTVSDAVDVQWYLDGALLADGTQCLLQPASLAPGEHLLEAAVTLRDSWLLADPDGRLTERVNWTVVRESALQSFQVSLLVQEEVTAGEQLWVQASITNVSGARQSFQASLDLICCDGSRINGFRRGSGNIPPDVERLFTQPIHIPAQLPLRLLECPLGLELLVSDGTGSGIATSDSGTFTIHAR
jgi:hypothetical protein